MVGLRKRDWGLGLLVLGGLMILWTAQAVVPNLTRDLYRRQNFDRLNAWTGAHTPESLEYYLGRMEDRFLGPLRAGITYGLLALFMVVYGKGISRRQFFWTVLVFFALTRLFTIFYPPYGDAIGGPFAEAMWLADHHFDYAGLLRQPPYQAGGPRVYFFSLYPTYLAVLMRLIPSVKAFLLVNHLIVWAMAAAIVTMTRDIAMMVMDRREASLAALIVLALPVFQSQAEAINMEIPCLLFSVASVRALCHRRLGWATVFAILSLAVKGYGVLVCATVLVVSVVLWIRGHRRGTGVCIVINALAPVALTLTKFWLKDQHAAGGMMGLFHGWPSLKIMYLPWIYLGSLVALGRYFWRARREQGGSVYPQAVVLTTAAMWFALFLNYTEVSPRYKLALAPYLVLCLVFALYSFGWFRRVATGVLAVGVGATALGSHGLYHFPLKPNYHIFSERSLEYRNDLRLNMALARLMEEKYKDYTIGAPFLIAQLLRMPRLGYVRNPLNVMIYGMPCRYGGIRNFKGLASLDLRKTIWVGVAAQQEHTPLFDYPVHARDIVIQRMAVGENRLTLFMGGIAIEQKRRLIQALSRRRHAR